MGHISLRLPTAAETLFTFMHYFMTIAGMWLPKGPEGPVLPTFFSWSKVKAL